MTDPGMNYVANPNVLIVGNGSGAQAVAQQSGGLVNGITVTDGGNGYLPITFGNTTMASVVINNGTVTNLLYR